MKALWTVDKILASLALAAWAHVVVSVLGWY